MRKRSCSGNEMMGTAPVCGVCGSALKFRRWSRRYAKESRLREALADCPAGCGKWGLRYFDGKPTCDPYQVRAKGDKVARGSYRLRAARLDEIVQAWGSVQEFLDFAPVVAAYDAAG